MRSALLVAVWILCACGRGPAPGSGTTTSEWLELRVPGARFFVERITPAPADYDNRTAILESGGRRYQGKDAMRVLVVDKHVADASALATFAELFLDPVGGRLVRSPADAQGDAAAPRVTPPAVDGKVLTYWAWTGGMAHYVRRVTVNLETFERVAQSAHELRMAEDPLGMAREQMASGNELYEKLGVDLVAKNCARDGAAQLLADTARTHARGSTRAHAAAALRACPSGKASVALLVELLERDGDGEVRWKAAETLGEIGRLDAAVAVAALRRAAEDADEGVKHTARRSLEKLGAGSR